MTQEEIDEIKSGLLTAFRQSVKVDQNHQLIENQCNNRIAMANLATAIVELEQYKKSKYGL